MSVMPSTGSPMLQSGGQNQKWPTSWWIRYVTHAVWGVPNILDWGTKSEVAHKWMDGLCQPCCLAGPQGNRAGGKIRSD